MEHQLEKLLRSLRAIEPDAQFARSSRERLLKVSGGSEYFKAFWFAALKQTALAGAFTAAVIAAVFMGGALKNAASRSTEQALNARRLLLETQALDFDVKIGEARYAEESDREISVALKKLSHENR